MRLRLTVENAIKKSIDFLSGINEHQVVTETVGCVLSILRILHSLAMFKKLSNKRKTGQIDKINTAYSTVSS